MRKNWLYLFLATIVMIAPHQADAQRNMKKKYRNKANDPKSGLSYDKKLDWADGLFAQGSYFNAIDYYQQLKQNDERNPYITYQLADCYRATRDYVPAAHYFLEVKYMGKRLFPYSTYYAGLMLKQQGEYQQAIEQFREFLADNKKSATRRAPNPIEAIENNPDRTIIPMDMKEIKKRAEKEILGCEKAIASIKDPEPATLVNAGPNINTASTELSPYPLGDSALVFGTIGRNETIVTTTRRGARANTPYKEKFMYSHKQPGYVDSFQWPMPFYDGQFNDPNFHTANGCWGPGGEKFYFSKCAEDESDSNHMKCNIYISKFEITGWGAPKIIEGLNEPGHNTMPFVAKVGKKEVMFFSSDRKLQSRGGYDLWYSIIDPRSGSFGRPQNCGKVINTSRNEVSPYYDSRTQTLYFASNGQVSFGGYDIYKAQGGPSRYRGLQNMGYPINTCADELYYILDPVGKPDGYVVSNRIGSYSTKNPTCCNDIWRIQYEPKLVVMGKVIGKKSQNLMPETVVKIVDQKGDLRTYNSEDGEFLFSMARSHSYVITGDKPGYTSTRASVSTMEIKRSDPDDTVHVTIFLDSVRNSFSVSNIYYDYDKSTLRPESVASLDSVVQFLTDNPSISVEIYSYTDAKGNDEYNLQLSQRRAQSVLDYLEKSGIERSRMAARGFGNKNAVAPNQVNGKDNPYGRQLNRRTEFRIVTDLPTRRVLYNSALPGSMDQQGKNLEVEPEGDDY